MSGSARIPSGSYETFGTEQEAAKWAVPAEWWTYLNPQFVLCVVWYVCTLPLCFFDAGRLWMPLVVRVLGIPVCLLLRPMFLACPHRPPSSFREQKLWFLSYWLLRLLVLFLPIGVYVMGYGETGNFIAVLHDMDASNECTNDVAVQRVDQDWFGEQPSTDWRGPSLSVSHKILMEYLQFAYACLYFNVTGIPFLLWLLRREKRPLVTDIAVDHTISVDVSAEHTITMDANTGVLLADRTDMYEDDHIALDQALTCLLVASYCCWIFYLIYPAAGPLWCFYVPDAKDVGYFFAWLNLKLQGAGAAHGTATPSSHCCSCVSLWIITALHNLKLAALMTLYIPALVIATVYLQYHYGVDAVVGTIMGLVMPLLALLVDRMLRRLLGMRRGPISAWSNDKKEKKSLLWMDDHHRSTY